MCSASNSAWYIPCLTDDSATTRATTLATLKRNATTFLTRGLPFTRPVAPGRARLALALAWRTVWLMGVGLSAALGQTNGAIDTVPSEEPASQVALKLAAAQEDFNRSLSTRTNLPAGATAAEHIEYRAALQQIARTYEFQLDDLAALEGARARVRDLEGTMRFWSGFSEPPPYSVRMVDELRNAIQSSTAQARTVETSLRMDGQFLAGAQLAMKERDAKIRRIDEQIEAANSPNLTARLAWLRELEGARYRDEVASTAYYGIKAKLNRERLIEQRQRLAFLQRQLAIAGQHVHFPQADLDKLLEGLEVERRQVEAEAQAADQDLAASRAALASAREDLRRMSSDAPASGAEAGAAQHLRDLVDLRSVQAETSAQRLTVSREILANLGAARQMWLLRFTTFDRPTRVDLLQAEQRIARLQELIEAALPYYQQQLSLAAQHISEEQSRLRSQDEGAASDGLTQARLESFQQREKIFLQAAKSLEQHQRFVRRWQESITFQREALPFLERVKVLFSGASEFLARLWHFEVYVLEDTITTMDGTQVSGRRSVTVGKISLALVIFVVGFWLVNVISRILEPIVARRLGIEPSLPDPPLDPGGLRHLAGDAEFEDGEYSAGGAGLCRRGAGHRHRLRHPDVAEEPHQRNHPPL